MLLCEGAAHLENHPAFAVFTVTLCLLYRQAPHDAPAHGKQSVVLWSRWQLQPRVLQSLRRAVSPHLTTGAARLPASAFSSPASQMKRGCDAGRWSTSWVARCSRTRRLPLR